MVELYENRHRGQDRRARRKCPARPSFRSPTAGRPRYAEQQVPMVARGERKDPLHGSTLTQTWKSCLLNPGKKFVLPFARRSGRVRGRIAASNRKKGNRRVQKNADSQWDLVLPKKIINHNADRHPLFSFIHFFLITPLLLSSSSTIIIYLYYIIMDSSK